MIPLSRSFCTWSFASWNWFGGFSGKTATGTWSMVGILCLTVSVYPRSFPSFVKTLVWFWNRLSSLFFCSGVHFTFHKSIGHTGLFLLFSVVESLTNTISSLIDTLLKSMFVFSILNIFNLVEYSYRFEGLKPDFFVSNISDSYMKLFIIYVSESIDDNKVSWHLSIQWFHKDSSVSCLGSLPSVDSNIRN